MHNNFFIATFILIVCCSSTLTAEDYAVSEMKPISLKQWNKKLQSYQPRVVIVDMWAMWCTSCIEQFPEMVNLHKQYNNDSVAFISMNLDDREDTQSIEAANRFLKKIGATFEHYRMDENLMHTFEQLNLLGIPAILIYDKRGNEKFRLTGDNPNEQFTKEDIKKAIQSLLNS